MWRLFKLAATVPVPDYGETDQQPKQADEEYVPGDSTKGKEKKCRRLSRLQKLNIKCSKTKTEEPMINSSDRAGSFVS